MRSYVRSICLIFLSVFLVNAHIALAQTLPAKGKTSADAILERVRTPFKGDLDQILERRHIRVLVTYSKTNFFFDKGVPKGFEYELLKDYETFLNKNLKKVHQKITMVFIPVPFDCLLQSLADGQGDIAAAGLTITPQREKIVKFTDPYIPDVAEVVVLNKDVKGIRALDDLAGRRVYVRPGSSYEQHLKALSRQLIRKRKAPIKIVTADEDLTTEDILEFVNAGIEEITVADHHIAKIWSSVLPNITVKNDLTINAAGNIAWAVRNNNPKLLASLNDFVKTTRKGSLLGNILFNRYYKNARWIKNPLTGKERKNLEHLAGLFQKYADQYGFDWLKIAAMAYQESEFDNSKKNPSGAVGIMQVMPRTAADKHVNIKDVHLLENNIHAGVKYLNFLRQRYFSSPDIHPANRVDFAWAAYNAGPAKINKFRRIAEKRGFDKNQWFFNVETIAMEKLGRETAVYVANINKYYITYKLFYEKSRRREKALKSHPAARKD
ncbi:MAG: transporter substrate-binding domain-containing protein [Deltaproteobacteria bacterium]|nr:transporter substrate-binding domain-containing protein [Deltaproteobacteria bacterium]